MRWPAAEVEEAGHFSSVPCCKTGSVRTTEFGNEKEGGGRDRRRTRSKENRGKQKQHRQETRSRWLEKESYIEVAMRHSSAEQERTKGEETLEPATF
ncbi:hypothetical protein NDU88_008193 [Pleurodeles waltl]|uniref:Uncharacterized protein n=1 Tax=Pleurodeles waltl TaxID=8319 RepID=A0AAV7VUS5_PLEWA|nr:hypothetical protein NDU88_008193 [Pleurodeles waltl]